MGMRIDNAIVNLPLSKRGNIDAQIDAYKAALAKTETKLVGIDGFAILCKGGLPRVYANMKQAEKAAARTGGTAYQSRRSSRFMVRFDAA
jgi:hypothetical protein